MGGVIGARLADTDASDSSPLLATTTPTPTEDTTEAPRDLDEELREAIQRVLPAIVTVFADGPERVDVDGNLVQSRSIGSGIIISDSGYILTNYHVIDGAETLIVVLSTGEQRPALYVSDDSPFTDLAVLRIAPQGLRSVRLGDSSLLRLGDPVAVLTGEGFTGSNSVKLGVISGLDVLWPRNGVLLDELIATDAAVNTGDSGSALITADGDVVGLLTIVVREGPDGQPIQGVALAQSSNSLRDIISDILTFGVYPRPRIGIERPFRGHIELTPEFAAARGLPVPFGAWVLSVPPGSPAAVAGVLEGDIVVGVGGVAVDFDHPFVNLLELVSPGESAELDILRDDQLLRLIVSP